MKRENKTKFFLSFFYEKGLLLFFSEVLFVYAAQKWRMINGRQKRAEKYENDTSNSYNSRNIRSTIKTLFVLIWNLNRVFFRDL